MSDSENVGGGGISRMQMTGILGKQPFGPRNQSTKWKQRFFVLKDGYLLYFEDGEKKQYEKKQFLHLHPKGILPLGGCSVHSIVEPGHPFCIKITSLEINNEFVLSADTELERSRWVNVLTQSTRITWRNAQLGDAMIEQLEKQGLQIAQEKQQYIERLNSETAESVSHKARAQELERENKELARLNEELANENVKLEQAVLNMTTEQEELSREMENTLMSMQVVEAAKVSLQETTKQLQDNLEGLEAQKKSIADALHQQLMESRKISKEKQNLSLETNELNSKLSTIEEEMNKIMSEKSAAERSLKEQEMKADQLLEDKMYISDRAEQLEQSIQELTEQKASTEAELQDEIVARAKAEERLREAEASLERLENVIQEQSESMANKMMGDVKTLKKFFENLAFESKLDAKKCTMIKNSLQARKEIMKRSKTLTNRKDPREKLAGLDLSQTIPSGLPTSPSLTTDEMFRERAQLCLSSPTVRHSVLGLLREIDDYEA